MASTTEPAIHSELTEASSGQPSKKPRKKAIWEGKIVVRALLDSFVKLDPRHMAGNPVMFVVEDRKRYHDGPARSWEQCLPV